MAGSEGFFLVKSKTFKNTSIYMSKKVTHMVNVSKKDYFIFLDV